MTDDYLSLMYSRKEGIADGVLVDVSKVAKEIGFQLPVVFTCKAYEWSVSGPAAIEEQDEEDRLRDVLRVLVFNIHARRVTGKSTPFRAFVGNEFLRYINLECFCGPDEDGMPCYTILVPKEEQLVLAEAMNKMLIAMGLSPR